MANDINTCSFTGNVTADPKVNVTNTTRLTFGIAVNMKDKATFINCVMFGKYAETMAKYIRKGMKVAVQGALSQYEKYYSLNVAQMLILNSSKPKTEEPNDDIPF